MGFLFRNRFDSRKGTRTDRLHLEETVLCRQGVELGVEPGQRGEKRMKRRGGLWVA